jgi:tetratricopeptide (TPR) repeat protein
MMLAPGAESKCRSSWFNRGAMKRLLIFLFATVSLLSAQQQSPLDQANAAMNASDFATAARLYRQVVSTDAKNGAAWEGLGNAALRTGQYDDAEKAFNHASELKWRPYLNKLNVARVEAKQGHSDAALQILSDLAATGKASQLRPYLAMPEFASLQNAPQFQKVREAFLPCRAPEFRQFDFWVGEWDVRTPAGQPAGTNHVTLEQDGCLLVEHWKSGRGFETGTSFNYYDVSDKKWHQLYIANNGNAGAFPPMAGELKDGHMVLLSDLKDNTQYRWTWYTIEPGKVRQMAEQTTDGGKTWANVWDSVYVNNQQASTPAAQSAAAR